MQLVEAGAVPVSDLDKAKARVLLMAALGLACGEPRAARQVVAEWLTDTGRGAPWEGVLQAL